jgi:hypothetical protein
MPATSPAATVSASVGQIWTSIWDATHQVEVAEVHDGLSRECGVVVDHLGGFDRYGWSRCLTRRALAANFTLEVAAR